MFKTSGSCDHRHVLFNTKSPFVWNSSCKKLFRKENKQAKDFVDAEECPRMAAGRDASEVRLIAKVSFSISFFQIELYRNLQYSVVALIFA